jgi:hypothetical protein
VVDANKPFELAVPVSTIGNKFQQATGFATLTESATLGAGYYDIKYLKVVNDVASLATTTSTLQSANNALLKGVNYRLYFDYDTTRKY